MMDTILLPDLTDEQSISPKLRGISMVYLALKESADDWLNKPGYRIQILAMIRPSDGVPGIGVLILQPGEKQLESCAVIATINIVDGITFEAVWADLVMSLAEHSVQTVIQHRRMHAQAGEQTVMRH